MMLIRTLLDSVVWHDVECGGYGADLPLWEELAQASDGPVLELGCGTGRVALHLARRGHRVTGIDRDAALLEELTRRAAAKGSQLQVAQADAADFSLDQSFGLILAPMQIIQLLPDAEARLACLGRATSHLKPGGVLALAIVEDSEKREGETAPLPDTRELRGWVYSSHPLAVSSQDGVLQIERSRQAVGPDGSFHEGRNLIQLQLVSPSELEDEGREVGLRPAGRREIEPSEIHVGSTVVLLEA